MGKKTSSDEQKNNEKSKFWFCVQLEKILKEKYQKRIPQEYAYLLYLLNNTNLLVKEGKKNSVKSKEDKNFVAERVMEDLIDDLDIYERYMLIPKNFEEAKSMQNFIGQIHMQQNEDTIWRKITGYPNINLQLIKVLAEKLKNQKVLEIMAGNGLLSHLLREEGIEVFSTEISPNDNNEYISMRNGSYGDVKKIDAVSAVRKYGANRDYLICSWPPEGEEEILVAMKAHIKVNKNALLLYLGEWRNGVNATDNLFDSIEVVDELDDANNVHVSHYKCKDVIKLVRLKVQDN